MQNVLVECLKAWWSLFDKRWLGTIYEHIATMMCKKMHSLTSLCNWLCSDQKNCTTNFFSVQNLHSNGILTWKKTQSWWQWSTWITKLVKPINLHVTHHTSVFQGVMHIAWQWLDRKCYLSHLPSLHSWLALILGVGVNSSYHKLICLATISGFSWMLEFLSACLFNIS